MNVVHFGKFRRNGSYAQTVLSVLTQHNRASYPRRPTILKVEAFKNKHHNEYYYKQCPAPWVLSNTTSGKVGEFPWVAVTRCKGS